MSAGAGCDRRRVAGSHRSMNTVATALPSVGLVAIVGAACAAAAPSPRLRGVVAGVATCLTGVAGVVAGLALLSGDSFSASVPQLLPFSSVDVSADALSG